MSEEIFELERPFERTELAALFQGFASALTDGQPLTVETEDGMVSMNVPERVTTELELEVEREDDEDDEDDEDRDPPTVEFEIELEWEDASGESIRTDSLAREDTENGGFEVGDEVGDQNGNESESEGETSHEEAMEDAASAAGGDGRDESADSTEGEAGQPPRLDRRRSRFEVYRDEAEEWRWRLVHWNGNIIADSGEGYSTRQSAVNGLESVRHNAPGAKVDHQDRS